MGKIIFWIIVVFVALFGLRLLNAGQAKRRQGEARGTERAAKPNAMVRCVRCGLFLPRAEATPAPGGFACADGRCAEHR